MKDKKNLVIALLTGLLALSLFTQPAQSAGSSKEAKMVEYDHCLRLQSDARKIGPQLYFDAIIKDCLKYKP
jgi:hypothetical protein